jgi:proteasome assembly chaperone (PAC2) family protein
VIEFEALPELVDPVLVAAFEGWNDAGDAASDAVTHLIDVWGAMPLAEMDPEDYYDYQVNRPMISLDDEGVRRLTWPTTRLYVARLPLASRDVIIVHGIEPNMRWRQFSEEILRLASELGVSLVITLGALLSDSPHTRPVPVTGTSTDPGTARSLGVEPSHYEGPTGIVGVLQEACGRRAIPSVSLSATWSRMPVHGRSASTSLPRTTTRWPTTCDNSKRRGTPPIFPRRAAKPSHANSRDTSAGAAQTTPSPWRASPGMRG